MATSAEMVELLIRRFKGVPNFEVSDAMELIEESLVFHGYGPSADVSADKTRMILLYAQTQGAWRIAFSVAHYFRFTDGEESVDKSMVAENYRKLARDLQDEYDREVGKAFGNNFRTMRRADRPNTTPRTGESRRKSWRNL